MGANARARARAAGIVIVCLDVDYRVTCAVAAGVGVHDWADAEPAFERAVRLEGAPHPYAPGELYRRELPALMAVLDILDERPAKIVVDGYVWLAEGRPGLGFRLHEATGARAPVIGVAKERFFGNDVAIAVLRGASRRPLYVTAIGVDARAAAADVARMHGKGRVPTMLRRADRLARSAER